MLLGFHVAREDLSRWRWQESALPAPGADGAVIAIEKFAFTANNVTYARLGEGLFDGKAGYWDFFPAARGWGAIPVWGIGRVIGAGGALRENERVYGYFPMASHLVVQPGPVKGVRFADRSAHRAVLPPTYNDYVLVDRDPRYERAHEDEHLVLRPLFSLSFCCAAFLEDEKCFGARRVLVSSASSKAALGLAHLLAPLGVERVGLTSRANLGFVAARGVFEQVLAYDEIGTLAAEVPTAFVDVAGSAELVRFRGAGVGARDAGAGGAVRGESARPGGNSAGRAGC